MHRYLALPPWVWPVVITVICGCALWKGDRTERLVAIALFVAWLASLAVYMSSWLPSSVGIWAVDLLLLAVVVAIALRTDRYWPIFVAGFHLLTVLTHAARAVDDKAGAWAYATAGVIFSYLMLFALAYGTWGAWRERRQTAMAAAPMAGPGATRL